MKKKQSEKSNPIVQSFSMIIHYFLMGLFSPIVLLRNSQKKEKKGTPNISEEEKRRLEAEKRRLAAERKKELELQKKYSNQVTQSLTKEKGLIQKEHRMLNSIQRSIRTLRLRVTRTEKGYQRLLIKLEQQDINRYKKKIASVFFKQHSKIKAAHRFYMSDLKHTEKLKRDFIKKIETADERKKRKEREKQEKIRLAKEKRQKKIEAIYKREKEKEEEAYREKKKREERRKAKLERKAKIKKQRDDVYINENVKLEKPKKPSFISKIIQAIGSIPKTIGKKFSNNIFARNARNRRDMNRQALLIDFEGDDAKRSDIKLVYEYQAKTPEGKFVTGHFEAFSKVEVHSFLLSEGYEVYKIQTNKWITMKYARSSATRRKFKIKDLIFFLTQLSTYLKSGITLSESLKILSRQFAKTKAYENLFKSINYELSIGENFSDALAKQGEAFPKLLINMIKTAEMTGSLPEVLDDMAEYYTQMEETRRQMVTAMMYPSIVGVFAVAVITFIMIYVVPQFVEIYETMDDAEVPAFTKAVIAFSTFLQKYIFIILIVIVLLIVIFIYIYRKNQQFRTVVQMFVMRLPVFGNVVIYNEVTTFTKTFGSLLSHNVPIIECMDILNKITNNEIFKMLILDVMTNLSKGGKISDSFADHWAFPVPAYEMIVTGEKTGELAEMMTKVSLYYQDLHKNSVARIKTFIEPALTVFLAGATGLIVMAIVIPMFNMYTAVQNYS